MKITYSFFGQPLLTGTCPVTGKTVTERFFCPVLHMEQVLKSAPDEKSVCGTVLIAEDRYSKSRRLRIERSERKAFLASGEMPWSRKDWRFHNEDQRLRAKLRTKKAPAL